MPPVWKLGFQLVHDFTIFDHQEKDCRMPEVDSYLAADTDLDPMLWHED